MRIHSSTALSRTLLVAAAAVAVSACDSTAESASFETDVAKASYGIGLNLGAGLAPAEGRLDMDAFMRGIEDAMAEREPAVPQAEIQAALETFSREVQEAQQAEQAAAAEENRAAGEAYMAENAERDGVHTTESGLQYEVLEEGSGPTPEPSDRVRVHYVGTLPDGTQFDSSRDGDPIEFRVTGVVPGFSEGLQLMPVGSTYRFVIPGNLAYGPAGSRGVIGPNQVLVFEVELIEIVE